MSREQMDVYARTFNETYEALIAKAGTAAMIAADLAVAAMPVSTLAA